MTELGRGGLLHEGKVVRLRHFEDTAAVLDAYGR